MKKTIVLLLCIVLSVAAVCIFVACSDDGEPVIESYKEIEADTYAIGDAYKQADAEVVAVLKNGKTRNITKNLVFVGEDALNLDDDGNFTEAGEYTVKIYALEEREDLLIGEWKIKVA